MCRPSSTAAQAPARQAATTAAAAAARAAPASPAARPPLGDAPGAAVSCPAPTDRQVLLDRWSATACARAASRCAQQTGPVQHGRVWTFRGLR